MTLNGVNGHFTLNFHYSELPLIVCYLFTVESVYTLVYTRDQRKSAGSGVAGRDSGESAEKLRIFRRRYIVGALTNKALQLTSKHVTLNDHELPFCVKRCFALVCLEL